METIEKIAELTGFGLCDILGRNRKWDLSICRQICWKVMSENGYTINEISLLFGRDISSVRYGIQHMNDLLSIKDRYATEFYATVKNTLKSSYDNSRGF